MTPNVAPTPTFSRFQAIISAKPGTDPLPPSQPFQRYSQEPWNGYVPRKRKRGGNTGTDSPFIIGKPLQKATKATENDDNTAREQTLEFRDRDQLILALRERFKQGPEVDFHGFYEMVDPGITHKQRIQAITHEIWKATGYRFTVKDHPQIKDGHKTRFWCSQDEAHRSKSSRMAPKPRVLSGGEVMAKTRYPCRSRLLISSRDTDVQGSRLITIRLHHHVAHEPYIDAALPPEIAQTLWEGFGWAATDGSGPSVVVNSGPPLVTSQRDDTDMLPGRDQSDDSRGYDDPPQADAMDGIHEESGVLPQQPPIIEEPPLVPEKYQNRMRSHIRNIRDFCDGLEYQLQFNDYRMLDVLEKEGGSFLRLVEDCLRKEGRLSTGEGASESSSSGRHRMGLGLERSTGDGVGELLFSHGRSNSPGVSSSELGSR